MERSNVPTKPGSEAPAPVIHAITEDSREAFAPRTASTTQPAVVVPSSNSAGVASYVMAAIVFLIIAAAATMVLLSDGSMRSPKRHHE